MLISLPSSGLACSVWMMFPVFDASFDAIGYSSLSVRFWNCCAGVCGWLGDHVLSTLCQFLLGNLCAEHL